MNKRKCLINNKEIIVGVSFFFIYGLFFKSSSLWWDSAVYIAMGKYLWSGGVIGLWEPARPPLLPFLLGFSWKAGLSPSVFGTLLSLIMASIGLFVVYKLLRLQSAKWQALLFTSLFSLQAPFLFFSGKILADIPAMTFSLISLYFLIKDRAYLSGLFYSLAILTKFTYVILIPAFLIAILLEHKRKDLIWRFSVGFLPLLLLFLVFNGILYGNPLMPFLAANSLINQVWLNEVHESSRLFYFSRLAFSIPLVLACCLFFSLSTVRKRIWENQKAAVLLVGAAIIPLIYHSWFLEYREARYMVIFLPCLFIVAGHAFSILSGKGKSIRYTLYLFLAIQIAYSLFAAYSSGDRSYEAENPYQGFYRFFDEPLLGEIWMSNPFIAAEKDIKVTEMVYYPVWSTQRADSLLAKKRDTVSAILINTCDIPCLKSDKICNKKTQDFLAELENTHMVVSEKENGNCTITLYGKNET